MKRSDIQKLTTLQHAMEQVFHRTDPGQPAHNIARDALIEIGEHWAIADPSPAVNEEFVRTREHGLSPSVVWD